MVTLKKNGNYKIERGLVRLPSHRNEEDVLVSQILGIGASRIEERGLAAAHQLETTPIHFEFCESVPRAGVLFLLPFLQQSGLFSYEEHYHELDKGYYFIDFMVLFLAFMYLCRIKNPEQLKYLSPGEFGKIMGLDRIPEAKCLRVKLKEICRQDKSEQWNMTLAKKWSLEEENEFYYIDGHVQVYTGYKAKLGKKHVARQKLCLPGMQEFWVNNKEGMPYFYISGEVNEKLLEMLEKTIIPTLLKEIPSKYTEKQLQSDPDLPRFTIVFDREAYSPVFFQRLWEQYRIAVLTYRKNVKESWNETCFSEYRVDIQGSETKMELAEKSVELDHASMREIRRSSGEHQTSVITTNKKLSIIMVALHMFSRWTQENFFKYMRQDYDFDRLLQYAVEQIDKDFIVVNPEYSNNAYYLKKIREKISRRMATLFKLQEDNLNDDLDNANSYLKKQLSIKEELNDLKNQENILIETRAQIPYKIKIEDMPDNIKYNKLHMESKRFQNIIKMICYRAETSFASLLSPNFNKHINEKRALVKSIINSHADIIPDYQNKQLNIKLYTQSNPRMNIAIDKVCHLLNETLTVYPGTELVINYKIATI